MKDYDPEFDRERDWLLEKLQLEAIASTQPVMEDSGECLDGIECGCCFSDYPFVCTLMPCTFRPLQFFFAG